MIVIASEQSISFPKALAKKRLSSPNPHHPVRDVTTLGQGNSTIGRRVAAIRYAHKLAGFPTPTDNERVRATVRGIRRSPGAAPNRKAPATADKVVAMAPLAGERLSVRSVTARCC